MGSFRSQQSVNFVKPGASDPLLRQLIFLLPPLILPLGLDREGGGLGHRVFTFLFSFSPGVSTKGGGPADGRMVGAWAAFRRAGRGKSTARDCL